MQSETTPKAPPEDATPSSPAQRHPAPKTKVFSRYALPSDRTPFSTHFDIMARFVTHSRNGAEAIAAERVEGSGVPVQAASMNVKFMASVKILNFDSKGLYVPSLETIRFVNAKTVSEDRARPILRGLIQGSWFDETARSVFRTRSVVTDDDLVSELAIAAETNKEKKGPALRVLLEYLVWCGIIIRDERGLSLSDAPGAPGAPAEPKAGAPAAVPSAPRAQGERLPGPSPPPPSEAGSWHIVQTEDYFLKVRSDLAVITEVGDQLALLAKKVERLRARAASPEAPATDSAGA